MATSFSTNLALALPATGELSGTWGSTVNSNITNMLDEALGYQAYSATGGADTLTIPDGTTGVARSIYIQLNGTGGGSVAVPTTKTKMYFVFNNTSSAITFKVTGQTGVSIPAAAKMALVSNGTDIIVAQNYFAALTLGAALPVASGGTALSSGTSGGVLAYTAAGTLASSGALTQYGVVIGGGAGAVPTSTAVGTAAQVLTSNGSGVAPTFQTPAAGASAATPTALGTVYANTNTINPKQTFLGYQAGNSTTGNQNTFVGWQSGFANTSGTENVSVGESSFKANTTGSGNVTVGTEALRTNTTGTGNIAIGGSALGLNTTGLSNVAVGGSTLGQSTTPDNNTAVGRSAFSAVTTGANNTALGSSAGNNLTTGSNNILIGYNNTASSASVSNENTFGNSSTTSNRFWGDMKMGGSAAGSSGQVLTSAGAGVAPTWAAVSASAATPTALGTVFGLTTQYSLMTYLGVNAGAARLTTGNNTFIGADAGAASTSGNDSVYVGVNAGANSTTAYRNTAIGSAVMQTNTTGSGNVVVGYQSGYYITTGDNNTIIGNQTGNVSTGSNNICIGLSANPTSNSVSNTATIGDTSITVLRCAVTTITAISDARDKTNILPLAAGLNFTNQLNPVSFDWNMRDGGKVGVSDTGFIAQDLQAVQEKTGIEIPGLVYADNPEKLEAGYSKLLPVMVKAIQELSAKIDALQAEIIQLKGA